ncbi:MAG: septum formation initiator family protein [Prevotella sp.]|nr:septum formation initiator family protein [Prevotella sp.]
MSRFKSLWKYLGRKRYVIVFLLGVFIVVFFDDNSILQHAQNRATVRNLKERINEFNAQYEHDKAELKELQENSSAAMKIAREKYFMKADDEDIFVLRDEPKATNKEASK